MMLPMMNSMRARPIALAGQIPPAQRAGGTGDVDHDLRFDLWKLLDADLCFFIVENTFVHVGLVALGAGNSDFIAVLQSFRRLSSPNNGWDAHFAADDRGVTSPPAKICHAGFGFPENRPPIQCGHFRDENIALFEFLQLRSAVNLLYFSSGD